MSTSGEEKIRLDLRANTFIQKKKSSPPTEEPSSAPWEKFPAPSIVPPREGKNLYRKENRGGSSIG